MDRSSLRERSNKLLGNGYLLEVAAAVGGFSDGVFTLVELSRAVGYDKGVVATALAKLEDGRLIKRLMRQGREQPYERVPSVYWAMCRSLLNEFEQSG